MSLDRPAGRSPCSGGVSVCVWGPVCGDFSGTDEAVIRSIEACNGLADVARSSYGPTGLSKIVINHLEKIFVTADAATIVSELEVQHPAAKLMAIAAAAQDKEAGDGANFVLTLAGELLKKAEGLIREGLHPVEIATGYDSALKECLGNLEGMILPGSAETALSDEATVAKLLSAAISSKQQGHEDLLGGLIAKACISATPTNQHNFNVDNIRIAKVVGGSLYDSYVVNGVAVQRDPEGTVKAVADGKVAVFAQGIDTQTTETKATVLIHNAEELLNYHNSEEERLAKEIKALADLGVKLVVSGSSIGELAMHYLERHGIMAMKIPSKFELRRICQVTGAAALPRFQITGARDLGHIKEIAVQEIGGSRVTVLKQDGKLGQISTLVLRGATQSILDDVERSLDDAVNTYKALCKDARLLPAGGAVEMELSILLTEAAKKHSGLEQYTLRKYSSALEIIPRTLAENSGLNATDVVSKLYASHVAGGARAGINTLSGEVEDLTEQNLTDVYTSKVWALKLATDAAITVLSVDQIIMAKQAGGKK